MKQLSLHSLSSSHSLLQVVTFQQLLHQNKPTLNVNGTTQTHAAQVLAVETAQMETVQQLALDAKTNSTYTPVEFYAAHKSPAQ